MQRHTTRLALLSAMTIAGVTASGCFGGSSSSGRDDNPDPSTETAETRPHDQQVFVTDADGSDEFEELAGYETDRWTGELGGARYHVEVPENWNEILVMYAHGYRTGDPEELTVTNPQIREYLIEEGFAWAASSYSANYYDVRAGVEDTNALALAFNEIAAENGRDDLPVPARKYIMGVSMGGHVAAAAIEQETRQTANNVVEYQGAAPFCGVMGDTELFNYFLAYNLAAMEIAGVGAAFPVAPDDAAGINSQIREALWDDFDEDPGTVNAEGQLFKEVLMNLSGGDRPGYEQGFGEWQEVLQQYLPADGTVNGILNSNVLDTSAITYRDANGDPAYFNDTILIVTPDPGANRQRDDGLRWIPRVNGDFSVPVVSTHTTGDLFVPFKVQQIYHQRAADNGSDAYLVQRAIRATGHCDFTDQEKIDAFAAMHAWVDEGTVPAGDAVWDSAQVADAEFGCQFTDPAAPDPQGIPACPAP